VYEIVLVSKALPSPKFVSIKQNIVVALPLMSIRVPIGSRLAEHESIYVAEIMVPCAFAFRPRATTTKQKMVRIYFIRMIDANWVCTGLHRI
jgi:hypothetical protein